MEKGAGVGAGLALRSAQLLCTVNSENGNASGKATVQLVLRTILRSRAGPLFAILWEWVGWMWCMLAWGLEA